MNLFPNIDAERGRTKMSQRKIAEYLGVSPKTFSNWMNGKCEIPCSAIVKMSRLWNKSSDYLLGLNSSFDTNSTMKEHSA